MLFCQLFKKPRYTRANIVPLEITIVKKVLDKVNRGSVFIYTSLSRHVTLGLLLAAETVSILFTLGEKYSQFIMGSLTFQSLHETMFSQSDITVLTATLLVYFMSNGEQYVVFKIVLSCLAACMLVVISMLCYRF